MNRVDESCRILDEVIDMNEGEGYECPERLAATFSIVAYDPEEEEWGIAVQSKLLAIGALSPWAQAGIGAVVTQSFINPNYGPEGLQLLSRGHSAEETIRLLTAADDLRFMRQVGVIDGDGEPAVYTGPACHEWAGSQIGQHFAVQGNLLVGPEVIEHMAHTYEQKVGPLAERLLMALDAGQQAGGDRRGQQAAALLVVKDKAGYAGDSDRYIDLRVDDHSSPIRELWRLYRLHQLYFRSSSPEDILVLDGKIKQDLIQALLAKYDLQPREIDTDENLYTTLKEVHKMENMLGRLQPQGYIDQKVYQFILDKSDFDG